ncbi:tetratricopeptide repeat protein [Streptomyces sp. NBC_01497]|uniref:tetratricopeptide repeat protein n=1 Tax=Streptomyces sp. NBC_01497 TaxID=2903885 RepID=UPI002E36E018|nr:tetratricopeptide repeat protein [Streptomyces sp. NBC_01497]
MAVGVGGLLVAGVLVFVPGTKHEAPPLAGPEGRALTAVTAGAPAAVTDLAALIRDRTAWVGKHPDDARAWAVLGSAYVQRGVRQADPALFPKAQQALDRALAGTNARPSAPASGPAPRSSAPGPDTGSPQAPASAPAQAPASARAPAPGNGSAPGQGAGSGTGAAPPAAGAAPGTAAGDAKAPAAVPRGAPAAALAAASAPPEALIGLASLADARHDYMTAKKWGEQALKRVPSAWAAYPPLIAAYNGIGDYEAAGRAADRLAKALPKAPAAAGEYAVVYSDRGWREDAAAKASDAVDHASSPPQKGAALTELGNLAWERGEPKEALGQYDAALQASPDQFAAQAGRGRALAALGRTDEAYQAYQSALTKLPAPEYALEFGELYDSLGLTGDAQTQYATLRAAATKGRRGGVDENLVLGRYEADHGNPGMAVALLTTEWTNGHHSIEVADALGWALYRSGDAARALTYATTATEQGRRSALYTYHRGEIERTLGMKAEARRHLDEALRTNPYFSPLLAPRAHEALDAVGGSSGAGATGGAGTSDDTGATGGAGTDDGGVVGSPDQPAREAGAPGNTPGDPTMLP